MEPATQNISNLFSVVAPGQRSNQVKALQEALIAAGHKINAGATGFFGSETQGAVDAWKKTLVPSGPAVTDVPKGPVVTTQLNIDNSKEPSSDLLTKYTSLDEIKKILDESTTGINKTLIPTDKETELKNQIADIRAQEDVINQGVKQYKSNLEGEGISTRGIEGRSFDIDRNTSFRLDSLALQEKNLLTRLGLEVEARGIDQKVAENKYTNAKDVIEYAVKAQAVIDKKKTDLINATDKMNDNNRQALQTILSQFKGIDFHSLSTEAQLKLQTMANSLGIPIDVIIKGMDVVKDQQDLDNLNKQKSMAIKPLSILDVQRYQELYPDAGIGAGDSEASAVAKIEKLNQPREFSSAELTTAIQEDKTAKVSYDEVIVGIDANPLISNKDEAKKVAANLYGKKVEKPVYGSGNFKNVSLSERLKQVQDQNTKFGLPKNTGVKKDLLKNGYPPEAIYNATVNTGQKVLDSISDFLFKK